MNDHLERSALNSDFIIRTRQWWKAKAGFLISVLIVCLAQSGAPPSSGYKLLGLAVMAIFGLGTLGHLLNDWSDIDEDRKAGKSNLFSNASLVQKTLSVLFAIAIGYLPWFIGFSSNWVVWSLILGEFGLFVLYSVKPFRIKRIPSFAVLVDAMYAYVNPTLFLWLSFSLTLGVETSTRTILLIFVWTLPLGLRHILNHHVTDMANDSVSGTPNLAIRIGLQKILKLIKVLLLLEMVFATLFFLSISIESIYLSVIVLVPYLLTVLLSAQTRFPWVKFRFGELSLDRFYVLWLGLIGLAFLGWHHWQYVFLLPVYLLLFTNVFQHPLIMALLRSAQKGIADLLKAPFQIGSLVFNWSLYYFRRWFLGWSEERNWGKHYEKHVEETRLNKRGTLAVFNQNFSKYSETFVSGQLAALDYRTFYYYGWPKPVNVKSQGNLVSQFEYVRKLKYSLLSLFNVDIERYEDEKIADSLLQNNVSMIVAHFGQMGAKLLTVKRLTGLPMMVVFHGYDVWNHNQLKQFQQQYSDLFVEAEAIVGVSRSICSRLIELGCAENKLHYLPAYVHPKFFEAKYNIEKVKSISFLSVGRFSKTKSPYLTILAFSEVLKKLPESKLVMIGHDDGEGLFEACLILAKALEIEDKIEFKGATSSDEVLQEMLLATIYVQHSVTTPLEGDKEGTPVGIMEALALGLPIVATDHSGIGELIDHGKNGLLVKELNYKDMAQQMIKLALDQGLRETLGAEAANSARSNDRIYRSLNKFSEIIEKYKWKV